MDDTTAATLDDTVANDASTVSHTDPATVAATELLDDELLVEEISIDGMCGVY